MQILHLHPSRTPDSLNDNDSSTLSTTAIIGIAAGGGAALILLICGSICLIRKKKNSEDDGIDTVWQESNADAKNKTNITEEGAGTTSQCAGNESFQQTGSQQTGLKW